MTATLPARRYVEHVMGMPISLALRGRHTDDTPAVTAWTAALAELRRADRVFSTYRADSAISRLGRGEITLADCPPQVAEVLALGEAAERDSGGAFAVRRGGVLDPSGVVKGWAAERQADRHPHHVLDVAPRPQSGRDAVHRPASSSAACSDWT